MKKKKKSSLDLMSVGDFAIVKKLNAEDSIRRRLLDIGLVEGTDVECVLESPFGDPKAYSIRGTLIAIRKDDAKDILIELK